MEMYQLGACLQAMYENVAYLSVGTCVKTGRLLIASRNYVRDL